MVSGGSHPCGDKNIDMQKCKSIELRVRGIVQGVGFRPYVHALARACGLKGYVRNDAEGVTVAIEGSRGAVDRFIRRFPAELPPLARVDALTKTEVNPSGYRGFVIRKSGRGGQKGAFLSPDMAVCDSCLQEMRDPENRRHGYWLINCTDCGPRYSITRTLPYDRPNTTMAAFGMCPECQTEYEDPSNRRHHAQPISCYACGPRLRFVRSTPDERNPSGYANAVFSPSESTRADKPRLCFQECHSEDEQALADCIEALRSGEIVAVKGLGGFHLMCDATREQSVRILRQRKRRPAKPFAVMFSSMEAVRNAVVISDAEAALIDSKEKPVVLVRRRTGRVAPSVAPGIDRLGVFLPYTPLHYRLFDAIDFPLVATSANLSDEPIIQNEEELFFRLSNVFDAVLTHDRDIVNACDDSVMQVLDGRPLMLRLARGFAPFTLTLPFRTKKKLLAVGANQKNAIALAFGDKVVLSPHIGDLGSLEASGYFERTLETFKWFYDFEPDVIVCDKHPGYETTKWARQLTSKDEKLKIVKVQHHYAHLLACMAEYEINEKILGFAFDGTGYGDDKTIWGGEVLFADTNGYERLFSLKPFRLIGAEKAVREPRRAALGLLFGNYGLEEVLKLDVPTVQAFKEEEIRMLHAAWLKGINAPLVSSMGRLFDAVASLAGIAQSVSYEGESGLLLETAAVIGNAEPFGFALEDGKIDLSLMLETIVRENLSAGEIASRFIATVAEIMVTIAKRYDEKVVLSGGVFQNRTLLEKVTKRFAEEGIAYYLPSKFPVNDGGIALGQIWAGLHAE
jgi:hydrogenase maturation protein HypF